MGEIALFRNRGSSPATLGSSLIADAYGLIAGIDEEEAKRWTMINVPSFHCDPKRDGTASDRLVCLDFKNQLVLVLGKADYCGVVKN